MHQLQIIVCHKQCWICWLSSGL